MERLPLATQTLYAELLEQLVTLEAHRSIGYLSGSFVSKIVKGKTYYYFQYSEPGGRVSQIYLGRHDSLLEKVIQRYQKERQKFQVERENIQRLCAQLRAGGAMVTDEPSARVLKALADGGVFRLEGVLIGTHAYTVIGNMLGFRWESAALKTQDIDIADASSLQIVLPETQADIPKILEGLEMGFLPVPAFDAKHSSTSFTVRGKELRVDILTPERKPNQRAPLFLPRFNVSAQPLQFLDFLMEEPQRGVVINGGGILVNVPHPARFALHKLIVFKERGPAFQAKAAKDLHQAFQLLKVLIEERIGDLRMAWVDLKRRGKGWERKVHLGLKAIAKIDSRVYRDVAKVLA